jgi:hypothetical protein
MILMPEVNPGDHKDTVKTTLKETTYLYHAWKESIPYYFKGKFDSVQIYQMLILELPLKTIIMTMQVALCIVINWS